MFINSNYDNINHINKKVLNSRAEGSQSENFFGSEISAGSNDGFGIELGKSEYSGYNDKIRYSLNYLSDKFYHSFKSEKMGVKFNKKDFKELVSDGVTKNNVLDVISSYGKYNNNKYTFFQELMSLPLNDGAKDLYANDFINKIEQYCNDNGIYSKDIIEDLKGEAAQKCSGKKGERLDRLTFRLLYRILQTEKNQYDEDRTISPDGKINRKFSQHGVNDCGFISALKSASVNPKASEMLNKCISVNEDGGVTVKLPGVNKEYIISKEELYGANEFANGDLDVRAFEIAANRYYKDDYNNDVMASCKNSEADIEWKDPSDGFRLLFGADNTQTLNIDKNFANQYINDDNLVIVARVPKNNPDYKENFVTKDNVEIIPSHGYSVLCSNDEFVFITNPTDTSQIIKLTHDEFTSAFNVAGMHTLKK